MLLVEDHAATRDALRLLLLRRNYHVAAAASAADARTLAGNQRFDFVLSDVGLPDGDGYQLMHELRAIQPHLQGIAISGYGMDEDLQRSAAAGFITHLVKPVSINAQGRKIGSMAIGLNGLPCGKIGGAIGAVIDSEIGTAAQYLRVRGPPGP